MTDLLEVPRVSYPEVSQLAETYATAVRAVEARPDHREAFHVARALLGAVEELDRLCRHLRNRMAARVHEEEQLSLGELAEALDWPVSRPRMKQILDQAGSLPAQKAG